MSFDLSQYKNIFGEPGKGLHQNKFKGTSVIDYGFTHVVVLTNKN